MTPLSVRRGCAIELAKVAILSTGYLAFFWPLSPGLAFGSALAGTVFATFFLNALLEAVAGSRVQRAVRRALSGRQPGDGEYTAITGTIEAVDPPLTSPFGQRPCVAYSYWIGKSVRQSEGGRVLVKDVRGFAFARCAVRSEHGPVALRGLSFDTLEPFPEELRPAPDARHAVRQYLTETPFEPDPGHGLSALERALPALRAERADPPLAARCDWGEPEVPLGADHVACERVIDPGQRVTAVGVYASGPSELRSGGVDMLQLLPGDLDEARKRLRAGRASALVMAGLMFVVCHAMLAAVYLLAPRG